MSKQTQDEIKKVCDSIKELLLQKNAKYGDSALNPERVFSKADAVEQIKVRIDDKLSRIATTGFSAVDEDTLQDLIGYLVLLKIALGRQEKPSPYAVPYESVLEDYAACPYDYSHYYGQKQDLDEAWGPAEELPIDMSGTPALGKVSPEARLHFDDEFWGSEKEYEYLIKVPGMRESILEGMATPNEELFSEEELDWGPKLVRDNDGDVSWEETPDYVTGWDPSLGPIEIEPEEIQERLAKKDLDQFEDDEIVSTIERRGMIIGFRKDGSSCLLKDGRCE